VGKFIIKDAVVNVNNVDLSDRVAHVEVATAADDVDVSTMGTGVHEHLGGLSNDSFVVTFLSDFDPAKVDATLWPLKSDAAGTTEFTMYVQAFSGSPSSSNPRYTSTKTVLLNYSPLAGDIGARSETAVTFQSNEAIVKTTA
jgi:hypothetical protein